MIDDCFKNFFLPLKPAGEVKLTQIPAVCDIAWHGMVRCIHCGVGTGIVEDLAASIIMVVQEYSP
jgi:hypothetical protein